MSAKGNDILRICLGIAMIIFGILGTIGIIPDVSAKRTPVVYVIAVGMIIWGISGFRGRKKMAEQQAHIEALQGRTPEAAPAEDPVSEEAEKGAQQ